MVRMKEETEPLSEGQLQRVLDFMTGALSVVRAHNFGQEGIIFTGMLKAELDIGFKQFETHYTEMTEWMNEHLPIDTDPDKQHDQMHKYMRIGTDEINKFTQVKDEKKFQVARGYA